MEHSELLNVMAEAIEETVGEAVEISDDTDLIAEEILDSLDSMVFLLELEKRTGVSFPQDEDLEERGFFKVKTLIEFIKNVQS